MLPGSVVAIAIYTAAAMWCAYIWSKETKDVEWIRSHRAVITPLVSLFWPVTWVVVVFIGVSVVIFHVLAVWWQEVSR